MPISQKNNLLWDKLKTACHADRLGHALLLRHFPDTASEADFWKSLYNLTQYLHCDNAKGATQSCGSCDSCRIYIQAKSYRELAHPDLFVLSPENEGSSYTVDQIRELSQQFSLRRALSPRRVAILRDAEYLSWTQAGPANALLKLLEEPRPDSILILTTTRTEGVLKTLQSRCQAFKFLPSETEADTEWDEEWREFSQWIAAGFPSALPAKNPADAEAFWKERSVAFEELKKVFVNSFQLFRERVGAWPLQDARRGLDFLTQWQEMLLQSRFHIQGHLHWLEIQKSIRKV